MDVLYYLSLKNLWPYAYFLELMRFIFVLTFIDGCKYTFESPQESQELFLKILTAVCNLLVSSDGSYSSTASGDSALGIPHHEPQYNGENCS